jgi:hypothetical protein
MHDTLALDKRSTSDRAHVLGLIGASWATQVIAVAVQLRLADLLAQGPSNVAKLASATACHAPSLRRLLLALASLDLVAQRGDEEFALTSNGALLRSDTGDSLAAWAQFCGQHSWRTWSGLVDSVRSGMSARRRVKGVDDFTHLESDRAAANLFNRAMANLTQPIAASVAATVSFETSEHVVDVGGGHGELVATVLAAHPQLRGTLFDLTHAIVASGPALSARGLQGRCELIAGSFFDGVPAGAEVYLLKSVLHDWDDADCARILRQCRSALTSRNARLVVIERIAPEQFAATARDQAIARSDLNMLVSTGGCERSERQFRALFEAAGLCVVRIAALASEYSAIETKAAGRE